VYAHGRGWYQGQWAKGRKHGKGLRVFSNGNRYDGEFSEGEMDGDGIMEYANGDVYIGSWSRGERDGRGVLKLRNGDSYEGDFVKSYFFGRGRYTYAGGGYYDGEFMRFKGGYDHGACFPDPDGKKNGRGVRVWVGGDRYEGEWVDDHPSGLGVIRKVDGGKFEGHFKHGQRVGPGLESWGNLQNVPFKCPMGHKHDGFGFCTYEGEYYDGFFHGKGTFKCVDGRKYEGEWRRGRRHGWGDQVMIPDAHRGDARRRDIGGVDALYRPVAYSGEWREGKRTGQGRVFYASGLSLSGDLFDGLFDGTVKHEYPKSRSPYRLALFRGGLRVRFLDSVRNKGNGPGGDDKGTATSAKSDVRSVLMDLLGGKKRKKMRDCT